MFVIWRGWGWLTLVFILIAWGLASGVIEPIYRSATGYEFVYNAEKLVIAGIAVLIVAALLALFVFAVLPRFERFGAETRRTQAAIQAAQADGTTLSVDQLAQLHTDLAAHRLPVPAPWKTTASFFFIPMWVLPIVFAVIGVAMIVLNVGTAIAEVDTREG